MHRRAEKERERETLTGSGSEGAELRPEVRESQMAEVYDVETCPDFVTARWKTRSIAAEQAWSLETRSMVGPMSGLFFAKPGQQR